MSLKNKLKRLKPHLSADVEKQGDALKVQENQLEVPYIESWKQENVVPYYFDNSYCLIRNVTYPLSHRHGHYAFRDVYRAVQSWNTQAEMNHPLSAAGHNVGDLFFFDTETTGLGGGAGNTIFLLGYAKVDQNTVTITQHFLPHPGAEVALYQSFLERIDYSTLVTYNGKAFDWPQVKTRHTLVREHVPKLPSFGHFDLYHAARRLWKHKLERIKLNIVEKEILGFNRENDVPGFLAPMIYFDYLERKHPEGILSVMKHNEWDILSLITLYTHLSFQLLGIDQQRTVKETYEVGRWFSYLGNREQAKSVFEKIAGDEDEVDVLEAKHALAFEYKRNKDWTKAIELWKVCAEKGKPFVRIEACVELAKFYEHQNKNYLHAMNYCEKAGVIIQSLDKDNKTMKWSLDLEKRNRRLKRKIEMNK